MIVKKNIFYIISIVAFCCVLNACQKEFTPSFQEAETNRVVVNCIFDTTKVFKVTLSQTQSVVPTEYVPNSIADAEVQIFANGQLLETLTYDETKEAYFSIQKPQLNTDYQLKVNVEGYETLTSEARIPDAVPITKVYISDSSGIKFYDKRIEYTLQLQDPITQSNYYRLYLISHQYPLVLSDSSIVLNTDSTVIQDYCFRSYDTSFESFEPLAHVDSGFEVPSFCPNGGLFADASFNGQFKSIHLEMHNFYNFFPNKKLVFHLNSLDETLFRYLRAVALQEVNRENPFVESVKIPSNIQNGEGIFAGVSTSIFELINEE